MLVDSDDDCDAGDADDAGSDNNQTSSLPTVFGLFNICIIRSLLIYGSYTKVQLQVHQDSVKRKLHFSQELMSCMFVATGSLSNTDVSCFPMRSLEIS